MYTDRLIADSELIGCSPLMERHVNITAIPTPLRAIYYSCNGGYVFHRALLIRPYETTQGVAGLVEWNDPSVWKNQYELNLRFHVFFAEDVVGFSYCLDLDYKVHLFDPEQGTLEFFAESVEDWAERICNDPGLVGEPLARSWAMKNGDIPFGWRIPPIVPFVTAESDGVGNVLVHEQELMKYRIVLSKRLAGVDDGQQMMIPSITQFVQDSQ